MRRLLDAHSLIWALDAPSKLGAAARAALQDPANELLVGAGTMWELSIKSGASSKKGKNDGNRLGANSMVAIERTPFAFLPSKSYCPSSAGISKSWYVSQVPSHVPSLVFWPTFSRKRRVWATASSLLAALRRA